MRNLYLWVKQPTEAENAWRMSDADRLRFLKLLDVRAHEHWGEAFARVSVMARPSNETEAAIVDSMENTRKEEVFDIRAAWAVLIADTFAEGAWTTEQEPQQRRNFAPTRAATISELNERVAFLKRQLRWISFTTAFENGESSAMMLLDAPCDPIVDGLGGWYSEEDEARLRSECLTEYASRKLHHERVRSTREIDIR